MSGNQISNLMSLYKERCHYCSNKTKRYKCGDYRPDRATKEHVVPRAFGGPNTMNNYVLACAQCNNKRGTSLFFCSCVMCATLINAALESQDFVDQVFAGMLKHNKCRVYLSNNRWTARQGHVNRTFDSWAEAMDYARNGEFVKGK